MKRSRSAGTAGIRDVAKAAGVAISTVSRTLSDPEKITEETRMKVLAVVEALGYTPNAAARNLRIGKSNSVMVILPGPSISYGATQTIPEALEGVAVVLAENGFNLIVANVDRLTASEQHVIDLAHSGAVRGAIVVSSTDLPTSAGRSLIDAGIPIVSLFQDLSAAGIPSVVTNDRDAMRQVALHLIGLGHRSLFYIAGPRDNYHELERWAGVRDALAECGLSETATVRFEPGLQFQQGFRCGEDAARAYLALKPRPTAAISCYDDAAIAFMATVRHAGVAVPDALSVVGFDGAPVAVYCEPALTTVQQPATALGKKAAEILLSAILRPPKSRRVASNTAPSRYVEKSMLVVRSSTAAPPR